MKKLPLLLIAGVLFLGCEVPNQPPQISFDLADFTPVQEFTPAYNSLRERVQKSDGTYDIEETIRIIHALGIAQSQSDNFLDFLEFMAMQDYSQVATEVVEAKMRLLPILQELFVLQQQYTEVPGMFRVISRSVISGGVDAAGQILIFGVANPMIVNDAFNEVLDEMEANAELRDGLRARMNAVRMGYIDFLRSFSPIYHRFMREWDRLNIDKDRAYIALHNGNMTEVFIASNNVLKNHSVNREALLLQALASIHLGAETNSIGLYSTSALYSMFTNVEVLDSVPTNDYLPERIYSEVEEANAVFYPISEAVELPFSIEIPQKTIDNNYFLHAERLLNFYIALYPNRTAPALLLKGVLAAHRGQDALALIFFDQSAVEFPRQAMALTDLLEPYRHRAYLNQSVEGHYLLQLYYSTMVGSGFFSPNFQKADLFMQRGMFEESKMEIYRHFFRRGNQDVYFGFLTDMQFAENFLYSSFRKLLLEQSFFDVSITPIRQTRRERRQGASEEVQVVITNNSDVDLQNVRVFLCLHYTDMYRNEYDIIRVPLSQSVVRGRTEVDFGRVALENVQNKGYRDIVRARAIILTNDQIAWINSVEQRRTNMVRMINRSHFLANNLIDRRMADFLAGFSLTEETVQDIIRSAFQATSLQVAPLVDPNLTRRLMQSIFPNQGQEVAPITFDDIVSNVRLDRNEITFELPRTLVLLNPEFSIHHIQDINNVIFPSERYLAGNVMRVTFRHRARVGEVIPLYIYSEFVNSRVELVVNEQNAVELRNVVFL